MKVSDQLVGKAEHHVSDVFDPLLDVAAASGANRVRLAVNHEIHDRKVVRRQVPNHVDVILEQPEIDPGRIEVQQVAEFSAVDYLFDLAHGAGIDEGVVHHQYAAVALGNFSQLFSLSHARRQRLF